MTLPVRNPATKPVSYADILALPQHVVGEIIDGELHVSPRPAPRHAVVATDVTVAIGKGFGGRAGGGDTPGGWWILAEPELHLGRDVLVPDIAGWRRERMPRIPDTAWFELAPDWVCEVLSPSTGRRDRIQKSRIYRRVGVPWMWLIDPLQQTVEVYRGDGEHWVQEGVWGGDDKEAKMPPFDAVAMDLARWWDDGSEGVSEP